MTPPPLAPEKKIVNGNDLVDHRDLATATEYEYDIKVTLPGDIEKYTVYEVKDDVDSRIEVKGVEVQGEHAAKFTITEAGNNNVRVTVKSEELKKLPGREVITIRIKAQKKKV